MHCLPPHAVLCSSINLSFYIVVLIVENESIRFGYVHSLVPLKKSLELHQDDWTLKLIDLWELPLEINVTPQLTSEEMETPMVLFAEPQSKDIYHFTHLVSAGVSAADPI